MHGLVGGQAQARCCCGRRCKRAERGRRMPALREMFLSHAHADAAAHFISGDDRGQEITTAHVTQFAQGDHRRQDHAATMQRAAMMRVIQFETLHHGAIDQRRVRRRQAMRCCPLAAAERAVRVAQRVAQQCNMVAGRTVDATPERIEYQQLDAGSDFLGYGIVGHACDARCERLGMGICSAGTGHVSSDISGVRSCSLSRSRTVASMLSVLSAFATTDARPRNLSSNSCRVMGLRGLPLQ